MICIEQNKRIYWIDNAKGLCMLLVVWMHLLGNIGNPSFWNITKEYIMPMYMPCFFILSGFFIKDMSVWDFIKKKSKSLLKPFLVTYLISFAIGSAVVTIKPGLVKNDLDFLAPLFSHSFVNGPIWFLLALFTSSVVTLCVNKSKRGGGNCSRRNNLRILLERYFSNKVAAFH